MEDDQNLAVAPLAGIEPRVSIFGTVRRLREQRCYMVKKQSQYVFLYTYMNLWIKNDLENGADPNRILFNFGTQTDGQASDMID